MTTNKIKRIKEKVKSWLPAIAGALPLAFLSTACVADSNEACPEDLANENQYALRLNIMAQSSSTRSSESGHVPVTGTETENYINIAEGDYKLVLYNSKSGEYITEITDPVFSEFETNSIRYYVLEKIFIPGEINSHDQLTQEILNGKVNVLVLANWNSYAGNSSYPADFTSTNDVKILSDNTPTEENLWKKENGMVFNTKISSDSQTSWVPSEGTYIPMFGYKENVTFRKISWNINDNSQLTPIPMVRALAKIEIIDAINKNDGNNSDIKASVKSVKLSSYNTKGRYIPDIINNPNWSENKVQVSEPTLPASTTLSEEPLLLLKDQKLQDEETGFVAYIPEMKLEGSIGDESRPYLEVELEMEGSSKTSFSRLELANYITNGNSVSISPWNYILRNHIYRYIVNSVSVLSEITVKILPWINPDIDNIEIDDAITIDDNGYLEFDKEVFRDKSGQDQPFDFLILNYGEKAKGQFAILSPDGNTIHIMLTTKTGKGNAFKFVDKNGIDISENPYSWTGTIKKGEFQYFYITPTENSVKDEDNQALLQVLVELTNGELKPAGINKDNVPMIIKQERNDL